MNWMHILVAETRREYKRTLAFRLEFVADQLLFILGFLLLSGLFHLLSDGNRTELDLWTSLLGFVTWRVADGIILHLVSSIDEESQWGTLEQLWLAGISPNILFFCRSLVILASYMMRAVLIAGVLLVSLGLTPHITFSMWAVFLLAQLGVMGSAYILMGLQLAFKRIASFTLAFTTALLFVTGALTPVDGVDWLTVVVQLLPLGPGIRLLQAEVIQPSPGLTLWLSGQGLWLVSHSIAYFVIGQIVFAWGERYALVRGHLGQY